MNKKEISEIKKQLTPANCNITRICGCYVDAEKNKKTELKEAFLSLSEEEMFKYFEIFKKNPFWYSWKEPDELWNSHWQRKKRAANTNFS